jgi:hypothetical protein
MRKRVFLSFFLLMVLPRGVEPLEKKVDESSGIPTHSGIIDFFGFKKGYEFLYRVSRSPSPKRSEDIIEINKKEVVDHGVIEFLESGIRECGISDCDFAKLLFVISFLNSIEAREEDTTGFSYSQILTESRSNEKSMILLATSLCEVMSIPVLPVTDNKNHYYLASPFCNSSKLFPLATNASFFLDSIHYYIVDFSMKNPAGYLENEPGSSFSILGEEKKNGCINLFSKERRIPTFPVDSLKDKEISICIEYNDLNYEIQFRVKKNLENYVRNLPLSLPLYFIYSKDEIAETGVMDEILGYLSSMKSEKNRINFLLTLTQSSKLTEYCETDIKPLTVALFEQKGDCDIRSLILAGILLNAGFPDILVLKTENHLCLALPLEDERTKIENGKFVEYKNREYYFLDPAIINGQWGTAIESNEWEIILDLGEMEY